MSMRLETFFKNFELLADAPNGVQKLRELILQLAVHGKLTLQDPNDEPAFILLIEKIKAEKERLIKEKKISKLKPLPPIEVDRVPYELPNWNWVRLGETAKVIEYGTSEKASEIDVGVPILRMNNINAEESPVQEFKVCFQLY